MSQYFVMDTFNSDYEEYETLEEALKNAEECIGDGGDGWAQELLDGAIKVGIITHISSAVNERETENKEWDFECECEMEEIDETFAIFAGECGVDVSGCFDEDDCKTQIKVRIENLEHDMKEFEKENTVLESKITTLLSVIEKQKKGIRFYASRDSWDTHEVHGKCMIMLKDMEPNVWLDIIKNKHCRLDQEKFYRELTTGGKLAREIEAECEKIMEAIK